MDGIVAPCSVVLGYIGELYHAYTFKPASHTCTGDLPVVGDSAELVVAVFSFGRSGAP